MAITTADAQLIAKAVWDLALTSTQTAKTYPARGFLTSASFGADKVGSVISRLDAISSSGADDTAMEALIVAALQSTAGQAAIRRAVTA
jgi:hypothetical protein